MRAVALLFVVAGLFAASQGESIADLGTKAVNTLVETGTQILKETASSLLSKLLNSLNIGKRALDTDGLKQKLGSAVDKLGQLFDHAKQVGTGIFKGALDKLKFVVDKLHAKVGTLTDSKTSDDAINAVVDDHNTKQKRLVAELLQKGKDILSGLVSTVKGAASKLKAGASKVVSGIIQKGVDIIGKRGLTDHLQTIGNALSSAVSPFKDIVSGLGTTLKGHFSNLVDTVKGHANALKGKLAGHVDDLKTHGKTLVEHGKNAIGALSEVVKDILQQTLTNVQPSIDGAAKTVADAGNTVLGHFTGSDSSF